MSSRHLLLCVPETPDAARQSGSLRLLNIVELLRESGWRVTLVTTYPGRHVDRRRFLRLGVPIFTEEDLNDVILGSSIDLALIAFWETAERLVPAIRARAPQAKIVIDSVDLHFVRRAREQMTTTNGGGAPGLDASVGSEFIREMNAYARADAVFTVSEKEARLLGDLTNGAIQGYCVPDCEDGSTYPDEVASRRGVVFLGNFQHPPNRDAVDFLCDEIVPHLNERLLADHPIAIVGSSLEGEALAKCRETRGVTPVGWVPSVIPYLTAARVSIVPLRFGAGTKRKVIQSLMAGTPTVATSVAVEGMGLTHGDGAWVEDDPERFAEAIRVLARDSAARDELLAGGREAISAGFDREHVRGRLLQTIDAVIEGAAPPAETVEPTEPLAAPRRVTPVTSSSRRSAPVEESEPVAPPIVVFGAPRSGTTYLNGIINKHPEVFVSHESRLFVWAHRALKMVDDDQVVLSHRADIRAYLEAQLPGLIRGFYRRQRPRIEHWGDKNPHYASPVDQGCLATTAALFPGAKFIHTIRDGRDVVASLIRKRNDAGDPWTSFESAHQVWNSHVANGRAFADEVPADRFLEVRYEELIADDVGIARRVFEFLEIEIDDAVVEFCEEQQRERTPLSGPTRDLSKGPQSSDWDSVFSLDERRQSLELLGSNLVRFGYESEASLRELRAAIEAEAAASPSGLSAR